MNKLDKVFFAGWLCGVAVGAISYIFLKTVDFSMMGVMWSAAIATAVSLVIRIWIGKGE